jgi:hypothetical protein
MTVREQINERLNKIKNASELQASEASEIMVELSSLMSNINEEIKNKTVLYNKKLLELVEQPKMSVAKAEIVAKGTEEWQSLETAKGYRESCLEAIRSLKYFCRAREEEMSVSHNL